MKITLEIWNEKTKEVYSKSKAIMNLDNYGDVSHICVGIAQDILFHLDKKAWDRCIEDEIKEFSI